MRKFLYERILVSNCDQVLFKSLNVLIRPVFFTPCTYVSYRKQRMQIYLSGKLTKIVRYLSGGYLIWKVSC